MAASEAGTLKISDYDAIGFDVDHTLSKYRIPNLFEAINTSVAKFLVDNKGYPKDLLKPFDRDFCVRGIVMDVKKGNFLKLSEDGTVLKACHGTRFMSDEEVMKEYGEDKKWAFYREMIDNVDNYGNECRIFENFFDMPLLMTSARMIDAVDSGHITDDSKNHKYDIFSDFMEAVMHVYDPQHFAKNAGGFYPQWKKDQEHFMQLMNPSVIKWFKRLKAAGKKLFIVTSSFGDFASATLKFLFGDEWLSYFDIVVTFARKPGFFSCQRPFYNFDTEDFKEKEKVSDLEQGKVYSQGNCEKLMEFFQKITEKSEPKVLFFGDSVRSDVRPAKFYAKWDTVYLLEEMVTEAHAFAPEADVEPQGKKKKVEEPDEMEKEYLTSHIWGSFFTDSKLPLKPNEFSTKFHPMNTLWSHVTRKYADIAIPQLEYISDLDFDHKFDLFDHEKTFAWGFYPGLPLALQKE